MYLSCWTIKIMITMHILSVCRLWSIASEFRSAMNLHIIWLLCKLALLAGFAHFRLIVVLLLVQYCSFYVQNLASLCSTCYHLFIHLLHSSCTGSNNIAMSSISRWTPEELWLRYQPERSPLLPPRYFHRIKIFSIGACDFSVQSWKIYLELKSIFCPYCVCLCMS